MYSEVVEEKRHVDGLELSRHMAQACRKTLDTYWMIEIMNKYDKNLSRFDIG